MRFLIAPNAYKGTFTALEAVSLIEEVLIQAYPSSQFASQALADGGDGTCALLAESLGLEKIECLSLNAIGQSLVGFYAWDKSSKTAFLDVSTCSGLGVLSTYAREPSLTSTYGTGILIQQAIQGGAQHLILGLGGSATIDLGTGILQALGFLFLDQNGREIPAFSPEFLKSCRHIQRPLRLPEVSFTCLCDVRNPFFGSKGAVPVFGPQKGLKEAEIEATEVSTAAMVELLLRKSHSPVLDQPGFGAAGGIAFGLAQFFPCSLEYGALYFFKQVNLEEKVKKADWILTGEGQYDSQSEEGKACFELKQLAHKHGKKIALIASGQEGYASGFDAVLELTPLDFSDPEYQKRAREEFQGLLRKVISIKVFD
ncbi:MAG: glycerate kinase [Algoriphagus sp.]|nr:glycerate kinase [Algoriphagus sp.]